MSLRHGLLLLFLCTTALVFAEPLSYTVQLRGVNDSTLRNVLEMHSQLFTLRSHPPLSIMGLRLRAEEDLSSLLDILHSYGYYNARIHYEIDEFPRREVFLTIDLGPLYTFKTLTLLPSEDSEEKRKLLQELLPFSTLGVEEGDPALATTIIDLEQKSIDLLRRQGYPFASIRDRQVVVDQENTTLDVTLTIDTGPLTRFGSLTFVGLDRIDEEWIRKKVAMKQGVVYHPDRIDETRRNLENTGLFQTIEIIQQGEVQSDGTLPITIVVVESKMRSVSLGVSYSTDQSIGGVAGWEHRNLFGKGETLSFKAAANHITRDINLFYRKPDFRHRQQDLVWQLQHRHDTLKSYDDRATALCAFIERKFTPYFFFSYGVRFEFLHTFQDTRKADYLLLSFPLRAKWSQCDNFSLPTLGYFLELRFQPYMDMHRSHQLFSVQRFGTTCFVPLLRPNLLVLATRFSIGTIAGTSTYNVPASIRFYEGSYGGLRGYRYQTVSPLDAEGDPVGGRSLILYSVETRLRLSQKFYFTPFYDLGNVFRRSIPQWTKGLFHSWGVGLSYLTTIGPVRFDVAFPLNRRPNLDQRFQFYFSIGSNF